MALRLTLEAQLAGSASACRRAGGRPGRRRRLHVVSVVRRVPAGDGREIEIRAFPARFSNLQTEQQGNAPAPGQHTLEVARAAGLNSAQIDALFANGGLSTTNPGVAAA